MDSNLGFSSLSDEIKPWPHSNTCITKIEKVASVSTNNKKALPRTRLVIMLVFLETVVDYFCYGILTKHVC